VAQCCKAAVALSAEKWVFVQIGLITMFNISDVSVVISAVGAIAALFFTMRTYRRPWSADIWGRSWLILGGTSGLAAIGFFSAYRFFNIVPAWPCHISSALFWVAMGAITYLRSKDTALG
jgi:hypothetical protein